VPRRNVSCVNDGLLAIAADSSRVAELATDENTGKRAPSCPKWTVRDLVTHLGYVQQFWAENVRCAQPDAPWRGDMEPPGPSDLAGWMCRRTENLLAALREAETGAPCWTWWGEPRTAGAVARHQVQEAAVHRWDAELATGTPAPLAAELAHDGVGEFLEVMLRDAATALAGEVVLRSVDTNGDWRVGEATAGGSARIHGTASDLVLMLYGRLPVSDLRTEGASTLVDALVSALASE